MDRDQIEILLIASLVAVACALPGVFLVLRRMALMSDAVSHAILPGIVLAYFVTRNLASPWLILGAALSGVAMVSLVELLKHTGRVREDAAIGMVFPFLFSIGVVLISRYFRNEHLDIDAVLSGKLELSVFDRLYWGGRDLGPESQKALGDKPTSIHAEAPAWDLGPQALYVMSAILIANLLFILVFYKELKLATFDAALAAAFGFAPGLLHYALMTLVSVTAVGSFDAVGSVLVVGFMIGPPATAYLLTDRLSMMLMLSCLIGVAAAVTGCWLAHAIDASIAGSMAVMVGVLFSGVLLLAPERGLLAQALRHRRQRYDFAQTMLAIHLFNHEGRPEAMRESQIEHLHEHLRWEAGFVAEVIRRAERRGLVERQNDLLTLTIEGRELARQVIVS